MAEPARLGGRVAASSNLVASTPGPDGQAVKTTPSHGVNPGSIPGQVIKKQVEIHLLFYI